MSNYLKYRGKCKELCTELLIKDPSLKLVRGYYHCAFWGKQQHWWLVDSQGNIVDPSKLQFPDQNGEYEEFDGFFNCEQCNNRVAEEDSIVYGGYAYCSQQCICIAVLGDKLE